MNTSTDSVQGFSSNRVSGPISAAFSFAVLYGAISLVANDLRVDVLAVGAVVSAATIAVLELATKKNSRVSVLAGFILVVCGSIILGLW